LIIRYSNLIRAASLVCIALHAAAFGFAQLPLQQAVMRALANSPQVKAAQNDLEKANANLSVMKDIYIPSLTTGGGLGYTTGITLSVPTIFTVNAQSLVFSFQQRQYVRAAHQQIQAAKLSVQEMSQQVQEDVVVTYVSLDQAQAVSKALGEQYQFASRLAAIDEDRQHSGLESELEVLKARRGAVQIKLSQMQADENIQSLRGHLASLTGLAFENVEIVPETIPALPSLTSLMADDQEPIPPSPGFLAAQADALAKQQRARGDSEYVLRPQVSFGAQYGRVSPINNVSQFYNLNGNYNTANVGIQIQLPLVDRVRRAAARASRADASRAELDLENLRAEQNGGRLALKRSLPALATKVDLAQLDLDIAQNELTSTTIQLRGATGRPPLTPKEEQTARIDERQRFLDLLDAKLRSEKAQINYLRQTGKLGGWIDPAASAGGATNSQVAH
jgi:outer membrane protein TolC